MFDCLLTKEELFELFLELVSFICLPNSLDFMLFRNFEWLLFAAFGCVEDEEEMARVPLLGGTYSLIIDLAQVL